MNNLETKEPLISRIKDAKNWYQTVDDKLKNNEYNSHELADLFTPLYNKTSDLENADSKNKYGLIYLTDNLGNNGHFEIGEDFVDFATEQANEVKDFAAKQEWNQAAANVKDPDALYVQDPSDISDVEVADDGDLEVVVSDILTDLNNALK